MKDTERKKLARYLKALGHPVRLQIIELLTRDGECLTGDLSGQLPVAASTTSQHLAKLREAELICGTVDGPKRCYCINRNALDELNQMLDALRQSGKCC